MKDSFLAMCVIIIQINNIIEFIRIKRNINDLYSEVQELRSKIYFIEENKE